MHKLHKVKWAASWQNQQNGMCAQRRLRSAWASLSAWRKLWSVATHYTANTDQTGQMPRLIWVFAGRTCHFVGLVKRWLKWSMLCLHILQLELNSARKSKSSHVSSDLLYVKNGPHAGARPRDLANNDVIPTFQLVGERTSATPTWNGLP